MAQYDEKYGLVFEGQGNQNWGLTLHIPEKVPLTTNSIFDTYAHMLAYVNNPTSSAIQGLTLAVISDTDATKNGIYYIKEIGTVGSSGETLNNGVVVKLSTVADSSATADEVQQNLNNEIAARQSADQVLSGAIDTNASAITVNAQAIADEISARTTADADLDAKISANTEAIAANKALIDTVSGDVKDNKDAIAANKTLIDEVSGKTDANTEAIAAKKTLIDTVSGDVKDNKDAIDANKALIDEVSGKTDANTEAIAELTQDIADEISARTTADAELDAKISANTEAIATLKVKDVAAADKILSLDNNGILSSLFDIKYDSSGQTISLIDKDGQPFGTTIDTADFVKDGMLSNVTLETKNGKTELVFTFNTDSGKENVNVDVTSLLNGTELDNLQKALDTHISSATTMHLTADEKAYVDSMMVSYPVSGLTNKFATNEQTHSDLNNAIIANKTLIDTVSGQTNANATAIATNKTLID